MDPQFEHYRGFPPNVDPNLSYLQYAYHVSQLNGAMREGMLGHNNGQHHHGHNGGFDGSRDQGSHQHHEVHREK
eukprot:scaffold248375_cov71-Cyclotella_meneghiniana.AAC.4